MAVATQSEADAREPASDGPIVYFDGAFMPQERATVPIATHALHYGTGCFEGIRGYWNADREELYVLKLDEHVDRFFRSCGVIRIVPPFSRAEMADIVLELLRQNRFTSDIYIRPIAFKTTQTIKLTLSSLADGFAIYAMPFGHYVHREGGLRACLSSWRRIDDNAIPARAKVTGSYINAALASDEAGRLGVDEALMLTHDGNLAEASSANVFLVRQGRLITPAVSENILEGITRDAIIELARGELGLEVEERVVGRTEVYVADEIFLCGTGVQIEPVVEVDGRVIGTGEMGPVTANLQALYGAAARSRIPAYSSWCTPVYRSPVLSPGD
ncbi:MAG TPA: branched-chain amino acid transaminase [Chloroflexota bacterium]